MKCEMKNSFKGIINGVEFDDEQSYDYLKEFIEDIENKFNLNINNKEATEFLQSQLYEETECIYNTVDDYEEAHYNAMDSLFKDIDIIKGLLKYAKKKINI
jgi:hypothetical protein